MTNRPDQDARPRNRIRLPLWLPTAAVLLAWLVSDGAGTATARDVLFDGSVNTTVDPLVLAGLRSQSAVDPNTNARQLLILQAGALKDVNPGDGGFICVPGSHKANMHYKPPVDSPLVVNPSLRAGDMLIFTEALVHGTTTWTSSKQRRSLLYKYSPGHSTWSAADNLEPI